MYIIIAFFAISCTKEKNTHSTKQTTINKKYFVKESVAKYVAENFHFFKVPKSNSRNTSNLTVKDITNIYDANNIPAYYIINYNDDAGYLILSADFRQEAIIGFGEQGNALLANIPPQLKNIIDEETSEIEYLRENEVDSIEEVPERTWAATTLPDDNPPGPVDPDGENCTTYDYTKGPLLLTNWGQDGGGVMPYNNLCPIPNGCTVKAPTGCVATAMSQIMYYHKFPSTYVWTQMQTGDNSTAECARLMRNAGTSVSMNYGCSASGAYTEDVAPALKNTFGYASTTQCLSYSVGTVQNEINAYRPVYLSGGGHAWVCDGYRFMSSGCLGTTWLRMNWGWNGSWNDYYSSSNWNPAGSNYNSNKKMVLVRKP